MASQPHIAGQYFIIFCLSDDSNLGAPCNIITSLTFTGLERRKRNICTFCVSNIKRTRTECINPSPLMYLDETTNPDSVRSTQDQSEQTYKARLQSTGGNYYVYHHHHQHQVETFQDKHHHLYNNQTLPVN